MAQITSPLTGLIGGYAYSTSWQAASGNSIRITSRGSLGDASYTVYLTVTPPMSAPATFASGGDFDSKNVDITGDVQTGGNYASGGHGSVSGNLIYSGTATDLDTIGGAASKGAYTPLNLPAIETTLLAAAGQTFNGNQSGQTFDFSALPGTNKVIYVNGNVSNPTFVGAGTLYVNGTYSGGGFGTAAAQVNIVATGDVTTGNSATIYGSIYSGGSWFRGKMDLVGLVYVTGISPANSGSSSMKQGTPPWFDPRAPGGAAAQAQFTGFAGPEP
jgi:hypothetical protein